MTTMASGDRILRVAIVGRPNVGKSTLFNRLVGRKIALVDDLPGVTRDRREGEAHIGDLRFTAIDTAGLDEAAPESLAGRMRAQTEAAVELGRRQPLPHRRARRGDAARRAISPRSSAASASRSCSSPTRRRAGPARPESSRPMPSASAIRSRSRPSTARASATSTRRSPRTAPSRPRMRKRRPRPASPTRTGRSASPSSGGRTPASRR